MLNAYDEDIENRLNTSSDKTLTALQFIKILKDDYGMTEDNDFWSIETWCYIIGYDEIADAMRNISPSNKPMPAAPMNLPTKLALSCGMYLSGVDFPSGEIKLSATSNKKEQIYYAILKKGSNSNEIITNGFFNSQVILYLKDGQRLEVRPQGTVELVAIKEVK